MGRHKTISHRNKEMIYSWNGKTSFEERYVARTLTSSSISTKSAIEPTARVPLSASIPKSRAAISSHLSFDFHLHQHFVLLYRSVNNHFEWGSRKIFDKGGEGGGWREAWMRKQRREDRKTGVFALHSSTSHGCTSYSAVLMLL